MWCKHCGQDVPGLLSTIDKQLTCARCGKKLDGATASSVTASASKAGEQSIGGDTPSVPPRAAHDFWFSQEKLRHTGRILKGTRPTVERLDETLRFDPGAPMLPPAPVVNRPNRGLVLLSAVLAWSLLAVGISASCCGGLLTVWSLLSGRPHLWNLGLPIVVLGQLALVCGLLVLAAVRSPASEPPAPPQPRWLPSGKARQFRFDAPEPNSRHD
jgi:hypothetical protein